jgi:lipoprotein-anchoring transpeptidase ErfK/SrfK
VRRALVLILLATALGGAGCGGGAAKPAVPAATPTPAFAQAAPTPVPAAAAPRGRYLTTELRRRTLLRAAPGGRVLRRLTPRTEFGSPTVLSVVGRRGDWLEVLSATLPNHRRGWVPAGAGRLARTDYRIDVDRSRRRARLRDGRRTVLRFPVAVGRPGNRTPLGRYAVTDKLRVTNATSPYGCCALALTGHQTELEPGWPGGDRLAIHGTPAPETIGQAVSLGCLRAPERALRRMLRRVPLGTPVVIRA